MPIEIKMPALSPTMEEGTLEKWLVREGDSVKPGDILAEIQTDKVMVELEAVDAGIIGQLIVAAGTDPVKVGTTLALLIGKSDAGRAVAQDGDSDASCAAEAEATPSNVVQTNLGAAQPRLPGTVGSRSMQSEHSDRVKASLLRDGLRKSRA